MSNFNTSDIVTVKYDSRFSNEIGSILSSDKKDYYKVMIHSKNESWTFHASQLEVVDTTQNKPPEFFYINFPKNFDWNSTSMYKEIYEATANAEYFKWAYTCKYKIMEIIPMKKNPFNWRNQ